MGSWVNKRISMVPEGLLCAAIAFLSLRGRVWDSKVQCRPLSLVFGYSVWSILFLVSIISIFCIIITINHPGTCRNSYQIPPQDDLVLNTKEYQINLKTSKISSRIQFMKQWIEEWNSKTNLIHLNPNDLIERKRQQYYLYAHKCGSNPQIRVRDYLDGDVATTIDIKSSHPFRRIACDDPYWPGDQFVTNSSQKCEHDIHNDDSSFWRGKYSRETRISFHEIQDFLYCEDLAVLFPWEFSRLRPLHWKTKVERGVHVEPWYVGEISGQYQGTRFKASVTLRYRSFEDLKHEGKPITGEWSLRVWSEDGGHSKQWNKDLLLDIESGWQHLVNGAIPVDWNK